MLAWDRVDLVISVVKSTSSVGRNSGVRLLKTTRPWSTSLKILSTAAGLFEIVVLGTVSPTCCANRNWYGLQSSSSKAARGFNHRAWDRYDASERITDFHSLRAKSLAMRPKNNHRCHLASSVACEKTTRKRTTLYEWEATTQSQGYLSIFLFSGTHSIQKSAVCQSFRPSIFRFCGRTLDGRVNNLSVYLFFLFVAYLWLKLWRILERFPFCD